MSVVMRWRSLLLVGMLFAGTVSLSAQTNQITARTPSRVATTGGTTVEVIGNGWFSSFQPTTVTMTGTGAQPTNVVVHSLTRLTFVTPARPAGNVTVTVTSGTQPARTTTLTYVARTPRTLGGARRPVFSYSGEWVAFESRYALVPEDTNGVTDIYVRNRSTGAVRRVSVSGTGAQAMGGESTRAAISATGRFVAFESRAANLVPSDTNNALDVFLHDRDVDGNGVFDEAGAIDTQRVSVSSASRSPTGQPPQPGNRDSGDPSISGDGRYIAFRSAATNLVSGDTNDRTDVFVHDRARRLTTRVSTNANQVQADDHSRNPAISLNGRFVAFESLAENLAGGRTARFDIFLHDRDADFNGPNGVLDEPGGIDTILVSSNRCEQSLTNHSVDPSITADGRFVVFTTVAGNADVDNQCAPIDTNGVSDVYIFDRSFGTVTRRLSKAAQGREYQGASFTPVISANGNSLIFTTSDDGQGIQSPSAPGVFAAADTGKTSPGTIPSPTTDTPPPPEVEPPAPTQNAEDPAVSGDGTNSGNTAEPDPGTGEGEPVVELDEVENAAPFIAGLTPTGGPPAGGNVVEIHGANFAQAATVQWNGAGRAFTFVSAGLLRVTAPAGVNGSTVTVRVIVNGESSNEAQYTYSSTVTVPVITSFNPATGPSSGDTVVTIAGTGFSAAAVRFGPFPAAITSQNGTQIVVRTPAVNVTGPVPVVVENGDGATAVSGGPFTYSFAAAVSAPSVQTLLPNAGPVTGGTAITIGGTDFAAGATVTVGGVPATDVQVLSNTQILAVTPAGAEGPADVIVTVPGQPASGAQVFEYQPLAPPVLTCSGTDTDLDGAPDAWETQYGLSPTDGTDGALDADADGRTNAQECTDLTHPLGNYTRFLAEGATGSFFDTRVVVTNPGSTPARVLFRFLTEGGQTVRQFLLIPATARRTVDVRLLSGLSSANVSSVIESDVQVVVDRTMRWDQSTRNGAHAETSVPAPSLTWYLAEGATHGSFSLFYLLQNPTSSTAQIRIRYLLTSGAPIEQLIDVLPNSRRTIPVDEQPGLAAVDVSAVIESLNAVPIIVERAMYSSAAGTFAAGHDSAGVTAPSTSWFFAEGATGRFFDYFLLLANPGGTDATVDAQYLLPSGAPVARSYAVPANSRRTIYVASEDARLADTAVSVSLSSTQPIIAERAMWWPSGQPWFEAHNSAGSTTTGTRWALADGEVGNLPDDTATFILVANTSAAAATVRVTLLFETGLPVTKDFTVNANSRFNVPVVSDEFPESAGYLRVPRGTRFSAVVESLGGTPAPIVVERAMYWNAAGVTWAAGSNLLATKLQ